MINLDPLVEKGVIYKVLKMLRVELAAIHENMNTAGDLSVECPSTTVAEICLELNRKQEATVKMIAYVKGLAE